MKKHFCLQILLILLQRRNQLGICFVECLLDRRLLRAGKRVRYILLEKSDDAWDLFEGDVGVNAWWILQVLACFIEHRRHLLLTLG